MLLSRFVCPTYKGKNRNRLFLSGQTVSKTLARLCLCLYCHVSVLSCKWHPDTQRVPFNSDCRAAGRKAARRKTSACAAGGRAVNRNPNKFITHAAKCRLISRQSPQTRSTHSTGLCWRLNSDIRNQTEEGRHNHFHYIFFLLGSRFTLTGSKVRWENSRVSGCLREKTPRLKDPTSQLITGWKPSWTLSACHITPVLNTFLQDDSVATPHSPSPLL